ncbi:MAG: hypothetical protein HYY01_09405 [Chloroflexi bacterium]|nr:hypothetical protein [Chloroflexota bacterium]
MPQPYNHKAFLERMNQRLRDQGSTETWDFLHLDPGPWTPFSKQLKECTVVLVSSAGVHPQTQQPFESLPRGEVVFYEMPTTLPQSELAISHRSYDHSDADRDINCVFPYERLLDLARAGTIKGLAPTAYTFMGRIPNAHAVEKALAPQIASKIRQAGPDLVLLTGG